MYGAGDVVDGRGVGDQIAGFRVVIAEEARVGELREALFVGGCIAQDGLVGDGGGDHLATLFGVADGEDLDARRG